MSDWILQKPEKQNNLSPVIAEAKPEKCGQTKSNRTVPEVNTNESRSGVLVGRKRPII